MAVTNTLAYYTAALIIVVQILLYRPLGCTCDEIWNFAALLYASAIVILGHFHCSPKIFD